MSPKKKRKNKNQNVSGERTQKVQVTSDQKTTTVPIISNSSTMDNTFTYTDGHIAAGGPGPGFMQSTPISQFNGPQFNQPQLVGYNISPGLGNQQFNPNGSGDINSLLSRLNSKMDQMSLKLNKLEGIEAKLVDLESSINSVKGEVKEMKGKITEVEQSVAFLSDQYDKQVKDVTEVKTVLKNVTDETARCSSDLSAVVGGLDDLYERHLDLQTRSMRDNLIFDGIAETEGENTEDALKTFIATEMEVTDEISFHRVHRIGKPVRGKSRPIVAKFVNFKDRENVRKAGPNLAGKDYSVNEQFPKEIADRRKALYPHLKAARSNGKKATIVKDKLFIDGVQFIPGHNMGRNMQGIHGQGATASRSDTNSANARGQSQMNFAAASGGPRFGR